MRLTWAAIADNADAQCIDPDLVRGVCAMLRSGGDAARDDRMEGSVSAPPREGAVTTTPPDVVTKTPRKCDNPQGAYATACVGPSWPRLVVALRLAADRHRRCVDEANRKLRDAGQSKAVPTLAEAQRIMSKPVSQPLVFAQEAAGTFVTQPLAVDERAREVWGEVHKGPSGDLLDIP